MAQSNSWNHSLLKQLPPHQQKAFWNSLTAKQALAIKYDWSFWARPCKPLRIDPVTGKQIYSGQIPPDGNYSIWLLLAGRGFGKTRSVIEWLRAIAENYAGYRLALVGRTAADTRDVLVEGASGILAVSPRWTRPRYEPTKRRLTWRNGTIATLYSADEPDLLRGPQHHVAIADELASWRYTETFDQLRFGLRLPTSGLGIRLAISTTPRPIKIIKDLVADPSVAVTVGSTFENRPHLSDEFLSEMERKYLGTRLGRQELEAEILTDVPGAMWQQEWIDAHRIDHRQRPSFDQYKRVVVAVDPAMKTQDTSVTAEVTNETGIIVAAEHESGHGYILDDLSMSGSPDQWAEAVIQAYRKYMADAVIVEVNNGGDMVAHTIRSVSEGESINIIEVVASRGKTTRAEPISAMYAQGKIHHIGRMDILENQMMTWTPGKASPDRMDALVWALTALFIQRRTTSVVMKQGKVFGRD